MIRQLFAVLALCLLCAGCGKSDMPAVAKVEGTVTYKGEPLKTGMIVIYPEKGRSASGEILDGKIQSLTTFEPGDGAPLGRVKVTVAAYDKPAGDMTVKRKLVTPTKYSDVNQTDLTATIIPGSNTVKLELKD